LSNDAAGDPVADVLAGLRNQSAILRRCRRISPLTVDAEAGRGQHGEDEEAMTEPFSLEPDLARGVAGHADEVVSQFEGVASGLAQVGSERGDVVTPGDADSFWKQVTSVQESVEATSKFLKQNADVLWEAVNSVENSDHQA
jgi:hypothetical protein